MRQIFKLFGILGTLLFLSAPALNARAARPPSGKGETWKHAANDSRDDTASASRGKKAAFEGKGEKKNASHEKKGLKRAAEAIRKNPGKGKGKERALARIERKRSDRLDVPEEDGPKRTPALGTAQIKTRAQAGNLPVARVSPGEWKAEGKIERVTLTSSSSDRAP